MTENMLKDTGRFGERRLVDAAMLLVLLGGGRALWTGTDPRSTIEIYLVSVKVASTSVELILGGAFAAFHTIEQMNEEVNQCTYGRRQYKRIRWELESSGAHVTQIDGRDHSQLDEATTTSLGTGALEL